MSRPTVAGPEASQGSLVEQCESLSKNVSSISSVLHLGTKAISYETLQILRLQLAQVTDVLARCITAFPGALKDDAQTLQLERAVQRLSQAARRLDMHIIMSGKKLVSQNKLVPAKLWHMIKSTNMPKCSEDTRSPVMLRFELAQAELEAVLKAIDSSKDSRYQPLYRWLPHYSSQDELHYWPPVAWETVTAYLLGDSRPQRMVIHGPSGSGKTTLLRQFQHAFVHQETGLHTKLSERFPGGLKWIDCGLTLSNKYPTFAEDLKRIAVALAISLLPQQEQRLKSLAVSEVVSTIREVIQTTPVLIVFDNVWCAEMFRPGSLDIFSTQRFGWQPKGAVLITSQFNIASDLNWHSPDTIVVPLTPNSNSAACLELLKHLWLKDAKSSNFPSHLEPFARRFVAESGASPLALKIIARLLKGTSKERKWQTLLTKLTTLCTYPVFRRRSLTTLDAEELPRLLYVYQLSAATLPPALQTLISALALFPSAKWVPLSALLYVYMYSTSRDLSESCTVIKAMSDISYLDLEVPDGRFLNGRFSYHAVLSNFVALSPDYQVTQLPSRTTGETCLALSVAKLYGLPAYQEQAAQVFARSAALEEEEAEEDIVRWSHEDKPDFWMDRAWILLLELSQHTGFQSPASTIVVSACRETVKESEIGPALSQLFGSSVSIFPAVVVFSDMMQQIQKDYFLAAVAVHLENNQAVPRIVMRLRELLSFEAERQSAQISPFAQEVQIFAEGLADLAQFSSINVLNSLRSEPMIGALKTYQNGIASQAHARLLHILGLPADRSSIRFA